LALFGDLVSNQETNDEDILIGVNWKNFIITSVIVVLAILFTVGIIAAIALTSS